MAKSGSVPFGPAQLVVGTAGDELHVDGQNGAAVEELALEAPVSVDEQANRRPVQLKPASDKE